MGAMGQRSKHVFLSLAIVVMLVAHSQWRLTMNREYAPDTWEQLISLDAPRPFGLRVLVPLLARPFVAWHIASPEQMFGLLEFAFSAALFVALWQLFTTWLPRAQALVASYVFFLILTIPFLLQHRWPLYYPYDTASMFFMAAGMYAVVQQRWRWALLIVLVGTTNRETTFLIPLFAASYYISTRHRTLALRWTALMFLSYGVVRLGLYTWLRDLPGPALHLTLDGTWRLTSNLQWLRSPTHWPLLLSYLGSLPLWWVVFFDAIPSSLRNTRYVSVFFFIVLMCVGNVYEPRIYGELLVLLYVPAVVGLTRWLADQSTSYRKSATNNNKLQHALDMPGVSVTIVLSIVATLAFLFLNPLPG